MDLFSDIIQAVQDDLTIGSESPLYSLAIVKRAINRSYRKAGGLFRWPETEDARKTSTVNGQEYYDYPQNWRPDSVWRIEIDGLQWGEDPDGSALKFEDYLTWKADSSNSGSTDKKWSTQWRRYFIYPTPTTNGSNNISIWGYKVVDSLVNNTDTTIFSYTMPECNEAVALEAVAILKNKGEEEKSGQFRSLQAKEILIVAWDRIRKEQAKYEKIQPMFEVPDLFANTRVTNRSNIGRFD